MEKKRFQQMAIMFLAHSIAHEELKFKGLRPKLGEFAQESGIDLRELEDFFTEFMELMHERYAGCNEWDARKSDRFAEITVAFLLHMMAVEGIKFNGFSRKVGQFRSAFKLATEECNEFTRELVKRLCDTYVRAPKRPEA